MLEADKSLWTYNVPKVGMKPFPMFPYMLLEQMFETGNKETRKKVAKIVEECRVVLGGPEQGTIFENFKTHNVLDLFEMLPADHVRMRLMFNNAESVAMLLNAWDERMKPKGQPRISSYWLQQLSPQRAFMLKRLMREIGSSVRLDSSDENSKGGIFISYVREDLPRIIPLYKLLLDRGYTVWLDVAELLPGHDWELKIHKQIKESRIFIACLSNNSVNKKGFFQKELKKGIDIYQEYPEGQIYIVPVLLEQCSVPSMFEKLHWCHIHETDKLIKAIDISFHPNTPDDESQSEMPPQEQPEQDQIQYRPESHITQQETERYGLILTNFEMLFR